MIFVGGVDILVMVGAVIVTIVIIAVAVVTVVPLALKVLLHPAYRDACSVYAVLPD